MKSFGKIVTINLLLCISAVSAVDVDSNMWLGVLSFFDRLPAIKKELVTSAANIAQFSGYVDQTVADYKLRDADREAFVKQINSCFDTMEKNLAACLKNKDAIASKGQLAIAKAQAQVDALAASTGKEILALKTDVDAINLNIQQIKETLAQLAAMNGGAADKAIAQLAEIIGAYGQFKGNRALFVTKLDLLLKTIKAYNFETTKDFNAFNEDYCAN